MSFVPIAKAMNVMVYAKNTDFFSFFNSPYYSHVNASAVDIYPKKRNADEVLAFSPVEGVISKIHEVKSPVPKHFKASETEHLIVVSPRENPNVAVKLLHINSNLERGMRINVGDYLGKLVRSGFFNFWTNKHLHIEVRSLKNPLRAKGAYHLAPVNSCDNDLRWQKGPSFEGGRFEEIKENYAIIGLKEGVVKIGKFWGFGCITRGVEGVVDGGIPHYGYGGVHLINSSKIRVGDKIRVEDNTIGTVTSVFKSAIKFKCSPAFIYLNNHLIKGLSMYCQLEETSTIKVIPQFPNAFKNFKMGSDVYFKLVTQISGR
ncbi:MAG: hypothetical protein JSV20_05925 [Candidatus Bathyarchaeota archaeon]|nr:MAG: hypothetical protein JSV20_05925 [Candidatus Bathyarchaeota archaeon]